MARASRAYYLPPSKIEKWTDEVKKGMFPISNNLAQFPIRGARGTNSW